ncbi:unnamed protein product [Hymenolepis diminuta]|uniref:PDZ domain-containing protein n=1 Tax=Hymenolepis diminuta TaxID=6216 RepID=A0A0R3SDE3_HYMDI|nr:unnamed protein product [Hymenolepis diminuta]
MQNANKVSFSKEDAKRALTLLKRLNNKLTGDAEKSLKNSMNRLIAALESDLFDSLIDINEYYRQMLTLQNDSNASDSQMPSGVVDDFNNGNRSRKFPTANFPVHDGSLSPGDTSDWEYVEVVISRPSNQNQSFGFSIAGGYDAPQEDGDPSIFITRIAPGGIAEADARLQPFDRIVSVNGTDLTSVSNQEAVRILRESGDTLAMVSGIPNTSTMFYTNILLTDF